MAENSKIEWTDHTMNFWVGCTKLTAACDFCYAESWAKRAGHPELWLGERRRTTDANWRKPIKWNEAAGKLGIRYRVFTNSLADFFDNQADPEWRMDAWRLIRETPNLDWLVLTKRPQNIAKMLPPDWGDGYPNVWLGATVENHEEAERRIPHLLAVPARVRFLSCEPLLGRVDLNNIKYTPGSHGWLSAFNEGAWPELGRIHWVITGGESGPHARPSHPDWFRALRDQCAAAGAAYLHKQNGEYLGGDQILEDVTIPSGISNDCGINGADDNRRVWRVGKRFAGRLLDGVEHSEFPRAA